MRQARGCGRLEAEMSEPSSPLSPRRQSLVASTLRRRVAQAGHPQEAGLEEERPPSSESGTSSVSSSSSSRASSVGDSVSGLPTSRSSTAPSEAGLTGMQRALKRQARSQSQVEKELEDPDEARHVEPWCRCCRSRPSTKMLQLTPDLVNSERLVDGCVRKAECGGCGERERRGATATHRRKVHYGGEQEQDDLGEEGEGARRPSRLEVFKVRMERMRAIGGLDVTDPADSVEAIHLPRRPEASRFSPRRSSRPNSKAPQKRALAHLTEFEIGLLERFCINHVRRHALEETAATHIQLPRTRNQHRTAMKLSAICTLLEQNRLLLTAEEHAFILASLKSVPFLQDIPEELLPNVVKHMTVRTLPPGADVFKVGEPAKGVYVVAVGRVVLWAGPTPGASVKQVPHALLVRDVMRSDKGKRQKFVARQEKDRVWSRTASATLGRDESECLVKVIFVPLRAIQVVTEFHAESENQERKEHVMKLFAPGMQLPPDLVSRHLEIFKVETFQKNDTFFSEGALPDFSAAYLRMVVQGEVVAVYLSKKKEKKATGARRGGRDKKGERKQDNN